MKSWVKDGNGGQNNLKNENKINFRCCDAKVNDFYAKCPDIGFCEIFLH